MMLQPSPPLSLNALLDDPKGLQHHIQHSLHAAANPQPLWEDGHPINNGLSVVFFLLGMQRTASGRPLEPCVILNKRSAKVLQPGDICCPGGGIAPRIDRLLAGLLGLPLGPMQYWEYRPFWQRQAPRSLPRLRLLLATALREGLEEMRLNPLGVGFQGVLPPERLVMFRRIIYPLVGWVGRQRHFFPNWEVAEVVRIPLRDLLAPANYLGLQLKIKSQGAHGEDGGDMGLFPAFRCHTFQGTEFLWGATYRITMSFLQRVFGFVPPDPEMGTVVEKHLGADYLSGKD